MENSPAIQELRKAKRELRNINKLHKESFSPLERFAVWITKRVGSMGFFIIVLVWTLCWLGWNIFAPNGMRFDPFPAFVLWLFISNMIQLFLLPLLMIGQNLQSRHAEFRAEADFETNLRSEKDLEIILSHLEEQTRINSQILEQLRKIK